jgi:hypothetical protein
MHYHIVTTFEGGDQVCWHKVMAFGVVARGRSGCRRLERSSEAGVVVGGCVYANVFVTPACLTLNCTVIRWRCVVCECMQQKKGREEDVYSSARFSKSIENQASSD